MTQGTGNNSARLAKLLDQTFLRMHQRTSYSAQMGDGAGEFETDRLGYYWARVQMEAGTTVTKVRCLNQKPANNTFVKVWHSPDDGVLEVARPDWELTESFYEGVTDVGVLDLANHGGSHSGPRGLDPVWVQGLQVVPGLVRPTDPNDLTVTVELVHLAGGNPSYIAQQTVDLTSYVPGTTDNERLVIVCWDYENEALAVLSGSEKAPSGPIWEGGSVYWFDSDIMAITVPRLYVPLAVVRLVEAMTAISWTNVFRDMRGWLTVPNWGDIRTSIDDTEYEFLNDKLIAGSGVIIEKVTDGSGVETLEVSASSGSGGISGSWDVDAASDSPSVYDDEFPGSSIDVKWTEYDPGTQQAVAVGSGVLTLDQTDQHPNGYVTGEYQALPAGDFTYVVKVKLSSVSPVEPDGYLGGGIALWEDATDQTKPVLLFGLTVAPTSEGYGYLQWTNYNTFSLASYGLQTLVADTYIYVRLRRFGTSYYMDFSANGSDWDQTNDISLAVSGLAATGHIGPGVALEDSQNLTATFEFARYRNIFDPLGDPVYGALNLDASEIGYTPAVLADWDGGVDPGNVDDALDQLAARVTILESGVVPTTRITNADSPYTVLASDRVIYCDTDGGAITVDLPVGIDGKPYKIINTGSSGNDVTIDGSGSETVLNELTQALSDGEILDLHFETTENWW